MLIYIKNKVKMNLAVYSIILLLIFTFYNIYQTNVLFLLGIGFIILAIIIFDVSDLFLLAAILAPNLMMIKKIGSSSAIFGYLLIIIFLKYILIKKLVFKIPLSFLVHVGIVTITIIYYGDTSLITSLLRTMIFFFMIYCMFKENEFSKLEYEEKIIQYYIIGLVLSVVLGLVYYIMMRQNIFNGFFSGIRNDRNYFSALLASGIAITLLYIVYSRKKSLLWLTSLLLMMVGGLLSASRTFILSMFFVAIGIILLFVQRKTSLKIFRVFLIVFCIAFLFRDYLSPILSTVIERFSNDDISGGNGRSDAWKFYLDLTFSSLPRALIGNGSANMYIAQGMFDKAEHNTLVQSISTIGILGSCSLVWCYKCLYNLIVRIKQRNKIQYCIPLVCVIFTYCGISGLYSDGFNYAIFISFLIIDFCKQKNAVIIGS